MSIELAKVEEENELLAAEVVSLRAEIEDRNTQTPNWLVRMWRRLFGRRIYDGPKNCGHCCYWTQPDKLRDYYYDYSSADPHKQIWYDVKGDCKLLFGEKDTTQYDDCHRFTPRRCYFRRVR